MSESCNHVCEGCTVECDERENPNVFAVKQNAESNIKKIIGVVSGKGGVGKSSVTSLLAVSMNRKGYNTAILDADITGPSIPKAFGLKQKAVGNDQGIFPVLSDTGINVMSINFLLENDTDPVLWRGPILASTVKQFYSEVLWGDIDYMFVDMPPGTGDVPLTVYQSLPIDGIVIVTSPQELVSMIVAKAVKMAEMMNIPIIGIVENMSYFHCPDNGKDYQIFGDSHIEAIASEHGLSVLGKLPIDPVLAKACDDGTIEQYDDKNILSITEQILAI
ncbi:MAG: Mrp/NBP35 family ATP-binding protein [Erysipelotrichaceae bacterium]|nr:Mrp/NBP35 family ATP-binding protein [Erysipelotrichaceae bacterium]